MGCGASAKKYEASPNDPPKPASETSQGPEVPPQKLMAIQKAFKVIDTSNSGSIEACELKVLFEKIGEDFNDADRDALMNSMDASREGKISRDEFVTWILAHEGTNDAVSNWSLSGGMGELHKAAADENAEKIKNLIEAGLKVNALDIADATPLHIACRTGSAAAVSALLEKNADVTARTSDTQRMPLHAAAEKGSTECIKLLLAAKAEINAKDVRLRTPLHWACASNREEAAQILLDAGGDLTLKSSAGYTPYAMAQDWSSAALADMIAKRGGVR